MLTFFLCKVYHHTILHFQTLIILKKLIAYL